MSGVDANVAGATTAGRRRGAWTFAVRTGVVVGFALAAGNASATALEGVATALRLLTPLVLLVLLKGRQSQLLAGNLVTVGTMAGLGLCAMLLWRSRAVISRRLRLPGRRRATAGSISPFGNAPAALPAHVDQNRLHVELRQHFFKLQSAWDRSERAVLSQLTTPTMLDELCAARAAGAGLPECTKVLKLDLQVLAFEAIGGVEVACVEFCGTIRQSGPASEAPFRELWMLTRETDSAGSASWRLARHQALL